jgi:hypothetical protein
MPLIAYVCDCKNSINKLFRRVADAPATIICEKCKLEMKKTLSAPSSSTKIVVDNGFQARAVEILPDIIEINEQRSNKNYREDD